MLRSGHVPHHMAAPHGAAYLSAGGRLWLPPSAPVSDIVAFRVDFADWLKSLRRRDRRIAQSLALGNCTGDVAKRFKVSAGRVSQCCAVSWPRAGGRSWATSPRPKPPDKVGKNASNPSSASKTCPSWTGWTHWTHFSGHL